MERIRIQKQKAQRRLREADWPDLTGELERAAAHRVALLREIDDLIHDIERELEQIHGGEVQT